MAFCLWLLSFEQDVSEQINKYGSMLSCSQVLKVLMSRKYDIIPLLVDVAQAAVKEKVIRVIVATFRVRMLCPLVTDDPPTCSLEFRDQSSCGQSSHNAGR